MLDRPAIRQLDNWRHWETVTDLMWGNIQIPSGFVSDGASVPRFLWALLPSTGPYMVAAFIHDYILQRIRLASPLPGYETRAKANMAFKVAMLEYGVNRATAGVMYTAVSLTSDKTLNERLAEADAKRRERRSRND